MKIINSSLPEWLFLDGNTHEGNTIDNRMLITHVRSFCIIEVLDNKFDEFQLNKNVVNLDFKIEHTNESLKAFINVNALELNKEIQLEILQNFVIWYQKYVVWEDKNILNEDNSKLN